MTDQQTLDFLMKGGWFTLEQAGRLINDARVLFEVGSDSSAAGLALLSREELAKSRELFSLWMAANRGETVTREGAVSKVESMGHDVKQRLGASMFNIPVDEATMRVLLAGRAAAPEEYDKVSEKLRLLIERLRRRAPSVRTEQRERAFYVDAAPQNDSWLRPIDMPRGQIANILDEARQDYWQQRGRPGIPGISADLASLDAALARWPDKPQLPPVEFPKPRRG